MKSISLFQRVILVPLFFLAVIGVGAVLKILAEPVAAEDQSGEIQMQSATASNSPTPGCLDNYTSWHSSNTLKADSEWSTVLFDGGGSTYQLSFFQDINGDGLVDFITANHSDQYSFMSDCVMLNNGHDGWDVVYRCVTSNYGQIFYGDCAG